MSNKHWIQTFTGRRFETLSATFEDFDIRDIARALAMQCRYAGHVSKFYSVAEHCVRVSRRVEQLMVSELGYPAADELVTLCAQWGLIHDASEAYLGDVTRPLKHTPQMAGYREIESKLQGDIAEWLTLPRKQPDLVTAVDIELLGTEARQLKQPIHPDWHTSCPGGKLPDELPGLTLGWDPTKAERLFLERYRRLFESARAFE